MFFKVGSCWAGGRYITGQKISNIHGYKLRNANVSEDRKWEKVKLKLKISSWNQWEILLNQAYPFYSTKDIGWINFKFNFLQGYSNK